MFPPPPPPRVESSTANNQSFPRASVFIDHGTLNEELRLVPWDQLFNASDAQSTVIGRDDLLEIDVFQIDELDRTVRVGADGTISLPLIGTIAAAGFTAPALEESLERAFGQDYLQSPQVSVFVAESTSQQVTMSGELRRPGLYPVTSHTTLLRSVAAAGGLSDIANANRIFLFRELDQTTSVAQISLTDISKGRMPDPTLRGGDVVIAFPSGARVAARNLREALGLARSAALVAAPL